MYLAEASGWIRSGREGGRKKTRVGGDAGVGYAEMKEMQRRERWIRAFNFFFSIRFFSGWSVRWKESIGRRTRIITFFEKIHNMLLHNYIIYNISLIVRDLYVRTAANCSLLVGAFHRTFDV